MIHTMDRTIRGWIMASYLEFVFFPIHDDSRDLLIHKDEDSGQKGRKRRYDRHIPRVVHGENREEPVPIL